jgi:predicted nucleic acid-binding protein
MNEPRSVLVVDASLLITAAMGRNSPALEAVARARYLVVSERALIEARKRIELGLRRPELLPLLDRIVASLVVITEQQTAEHIERAERTLRDAVASQNGSVRDAHVLSCAWVTNADIWTFDRDFAGTGVASWSTANLMRALAEDGAKRHGGLS